MTRGQPGSKEERLISGTGLQLTKNAAARRLKNLIREEFGSDLEFIHAPENGSVII